jgi:hypothetical protein
MNKESYEIDAKNNMVYQANFQGMQTRMATDNPTYAYYHL